MELEIEPEPSAEEREAIVRALSEESGDGVGPPAYRSVWRDGGIRENALEAGPREPADPGA